MGMLDMFSREGRENARIKRDYYECQEQRQEKLLSFRTKAIQDILFQYPDAKILLNRNYPSFMVLLKNGELRLGEFADAYYPRLDYVDVLGNPSEIRSATERYRQAVSECRGNFSRDMAPKLFQHVEEHEKSLMKKGYGIVQKFYPRQPSSGYLLGASLFVNGRRIATSSIWNPQSKGYLTGKILDIGVAESSKHGLITISLCIVSCNYVGEQTKWRYSLVIDVSPNNFDDNLRKEYADAIINMRDFVYDLEDHIKVDPGELDMFLEDDYVKEDLETP